MREFKAFLLFFIIGILLMWFADDILWFLMEYNLDPNFSFELRQTTAFLTVMAIPIGLIVYFCIKFKEKRMKKYREI
jgi:hypothetical protein